MCECCDASDAHVLMCANVLTLMVSCVYIRLRLVKNSMHVSEDGQVVTS